MIKPPSFKVYAKVWHANLPSSNMGTCRGRST